VQGIPRRQVPGKTLHIFPIRSANDIRSEAGLVVIKLGKQSPLLPLSTHNKLE